MSLGPVFKSPLTDLTGCVINHQMYDKCADMEMNLMDCLEAYGMQRGIKKCKLLIEDFQECVGAKKQQMRIEAMRNERDRQYYFGNKKQHYAPGPKEDAY